MFNVGKLIKIIAIVFGFLLILGLMYCGAMVWNSIDYENSLLFFVVWSCGCALVVFLISVLIYGFGVLIDSNNEILDLLKKEYKK